MKRKYCTDLIQKAFSIIFISWPRDCWLMEGFSQFASDFIEACTNFNLDFLHKNNIPNNCGSHQRSFKSTL
jgi:hypothetical protein